MKITSWNINSVRLRIELVKEFMSRNQPDILCLQETKCDDGSFPVKNFIQSGYPSLYYKGQKSYNGVAILSKIELTEIDTSTITGDIDGARHLSVTLPQGIKLRNYYIPAGGDIPSEQDNPKFSHKMNFVRSLIKNADPETSQIILGDFNIAPYEHDVWSHKQLLDVVSHTPQEVDALNALKQAGDFCDIAREFIPSSEKLYSWWSYRNRDWEKSNRGRRLDHIWCSNHLKKSVTDFIIHKEYRNYDRPSDHVPITITFEV